MLQSADEMVGPEVPSWTLGPPSPSWTELSVGSPTGFHKTARRWDDSDNTLPVLTDQSDSTLEVVCLEKGLLKRSQSLLKRSQTATHASRKRSRGILRQDSSEKKVLISPALKRARASKPSKQIQRRISFLPASHEQTGRHSEIIAEPFTELAGIEPTTEPLLAWSEDLTLISDTVVAAESDDMRTVLSAPPPQDMDGMDTEEFMSEFWGDHLMDLTPPTNDSLIDAAQSFDVLSLPETAPATPAAVAPTHTHLTASDAGLELTPDLAALMNGVSDDQLMELSALLEPEKPASPAPHQPLVITPAQVSTTSVDLGALLRESEIIFSSEEPAAPTTTDLARPSPPGSAFSCSSGGVSDQSLPHQRHTSGQSIVILSPESQRSVAASPVSRRHASSQSYVSVSSASSHDYVTVVSPPQSRHISGQSSISAVVDDVEESRQQPTHYLLVLPADIDSALTTTADPHGNQSEPESQPEKPTTGTRRGTKRAAATASTSPRRRSVAADDDAEDISAAEKYRRIRDNNNVASRRSRLQRKQRELSTVERLDELTNENTQLKEKAETLERLLEQVKALTPLLTAKRQ